MNNSLEKKSFDFSKIDPEEITDNVFHLIGNDWMLITAGNLQSYNTMTASWGFMGILWNKPLAVCFIRPQRFTLEFVNKNDYYTLSFFTEEHRNILKFCGTKSGRDHDKALETGLIPVSTPQGNVTFSQARMVLECQKIYTGEIKEENFLLKELISSNYPSKDFHRFFFGEIHNVYTAGR